MPHSLAYLPLWALSRKWDDVLIIYAHSKAQMTCFWSNHFEGRESASRGVMQSEIETSALCRGATYLAQNAADLNSSIFSFRAQFLVLWCCQLTSLCSLARDPESCILTSQEDENCWEKTPRQQYVKEQIVGGHLFASLWDILTSANLNIINIIRKSHEKFMLTA